MLKINQSSLVQSVVYRLSLNGQGPVVEIKDIVDQALKEDQETTGGIVFHQGQTPRNSVRRALYRLIDTDVLMVKDGHGRLRFRVEALRDVILQGDAWGIMQLIPDDCISVIIADPPWTHLAEHRGRPGHNLKGQPTTRMTTNSYFKEKDVDEALLGEYYRVLKPGGYLALYMPPLQRTALRIWRNVTAIIEDEGFMAVRENAWFKRRSMGYRWTSAHEPIWCFAKPLKGGKLRPCDDRSVTSVIKVNAPSGKNRSVYTDFTDEDDKAWSDAVRKYGSKKKIPREERKALKGRYHDTEKPIEVARHILKVAKEPGGLLLECFAGTGHACVVASEFGMSFVAIEADERVVNYCLGPRLGEKLKGIIEVKN